MAYHHPIRKINNQEPVQPSLSPSLMSQVAHQFPEPMPVVLKVQLSATPVATLHTNNSTLQLRPFIEVLTASPNSALQLLFSLDVVSDRPGGTGWVGVMLLKTLPALCSPYLLCFIHIYLLNMPGHSVSGPCHM